MSTPLQPKNRIYRVFFRGTVLSLSLSLFACGQNGVITTPTGVAQNNNSFNTQSVTRKAIPQDAQLVSCSSLEIKPINSANRTDMGTLTFEIAREQSGEAIANGELASNYGNLMYSTLWNQPLTWNYNNPLIYNRLNPNMAHQGKMAIETKELDFHHLTLKVSSFLWSNQNYSLEIHFDPKEYEQIAGAGIMSDSLYTLKVKSGRMARLALNNVIPGIWTNTYTYFTPPAVLNVHGSCNIRGEILGPGASANTASAI